MESLGIDPQEKGLEEIFLRRKELEQREKQLRAEQRAKISGTTVEEELSRGSSYSSYGRRAERDSKVRTAINARADAIEPDILLESDLGRRVLSLRQEKDVLLDTVWLATSPKQIKELWEQVNALLSACPTTLESKALEMEPAEGE